MTASREVEAARLLAGSARRRMGYARAFARAARGVGEAGREAGKSIEGIYYTRTVERVRGLATLSGIGLAAVGLATGAPIHLALPRLVVNLYTLQRLGRRVRATRDIAVTLDQALAEILA